MNDAYMYKVGLPCLVRGVTILKNDDYIVFINEYLNETLQEEAKEHELKHIKYNHLYDCRDVMECENECERYRECLGW